MRRPSPSAAAAQTRARQELASGLGRGRGLFMAVGIFSVFVNLLMLTGPLFMLQVYDRVLSSRSEATLTALFMLVVILYALMGLLDYARGRVAARIGAQFQATLDSRVFDALLRRAVMPPERSRPASGLQDLESVQRFMSSPVLFAIFDMPWTPVFLAAIFIFHPLMGWLAICGGLVLVVVTVFNQMTTRRPMRDASSAAAQSTAFSDSARDEAEVIQGLGMRPAVMARWQKMRDVSLSEHVGAADLTGTFGAITKSFRLFVQSAMLALGAWLVLRGELTPGAMIAGSILMGRALAPVEQAINGWSTFQRARQEIQHRCPVRALLWKPSS